MKGIIYAIATIAHLSSPGKIYCLDLPRTSTPPQLKKKASRSDEEADLTLLLFVLVPSFSQGAGSMLLDMSFGADPGS